VAAVPVDDPETGVVIYESGLARRPPSPELFTKHWNMARRLNLVQGRDPGQPCILEIFTWGAGSIPDSAPDEITRVAGRSDRSSKPAKAARESISRTYTA